MFHQPNHRCATPTLATVAVLLASCFDLGSNVAAQERQPTAKQLQHFETHVRPLLHTRCVKCHGENQQKGELRLDSLEGLLTGGESGPAAIAGKPNESLLLEAVRYESFEMPPDNPLTKSEIEHLEKWIADGAAWPMTDGQSVRLTGAVFTKEERDFWSLQPITHPTPPDVEADWIKNNVDRFVAAKLLKAGIDPAPPADDQALLRRLYFDVVGVPPSLADMENFHDVSDDRDSEQSEASERANSDDKLSSLIDQLLADTRYGEHWGRYWLDVVRYAESDGFRADFFRPDAWRYRDYVVNAFNNDKSYDRFVLEQLAGDEVAPDRAEALVATGYLRTYLYEYNQRDARTQWQDILNQVTDVTGEAFLGMGVGCARCHDHKFDPILQEDYFRLQACFGTMIPRDDAPAADRNERERYTAAKNAWLKKSDGLRAELKKIRQPYMDRAAEGAIRKFPADVKSIMAKDPAERTVLESQLADLVDRQVLFDQERAKIKDEDQAKIKELEKQITELAGQEPQKLPSALTVADVSSTPQNIHLAANPGRKAVDAGGFTIVHPQAFDVRPTQTSTGQRTALAKWITSPENPLTARVIVNRIWQQHFGTGLVSTASDFGSLGGRPSHPELMDWLASEFIAHNWSIKWLHRQILNSATWQMSSSHPNAAAARKMDPGNQLRWRFGVRRLNAEQIRDAMLATSGELLSESGGPSVDHKSLRRSLYLKVLRNTPEPLMKSLDGVDGLNSIPKRSTTTTPTQALNLMNGDWVRSRANAMAARVLDESSDETRAAIATTAFQLAVGRRPTSEELEVATNLITESLPNIDGATDDRRLGSISEHSGTAINVNDDDMSPLHTAENDPVVAAPFSVAGVFRLNSLYADATVRTIVSQWNSSNTSPGWGIGVTSTKSAFKPRNLILQVVGEQGYEVVASNLRPELDVAYLFAVTVQQTESARGRATFVLQPLDVTKGALQTAEVSFKSANGLTGAFPITVGGRTKQSRHRWDGQLDQICLFDRMLNIVTIEGLFQKRLSTAAVLKQTPTALWNFDHPENMTADASPSGHRLISADKPSGSPLETSVAALCHVLLNSNEFVYID